MYARARMCDTHAHAHARCACVRECVRPHAHARCVHAALCTNESTNTAYADAGTRTLARKRTHALVRRAAASSCVRVFALTVHASVLRASGTWCAWAERMGARQRRSAPTSAN